MSTLPSRIKAIIEQLQCDIYEKETEVTLALLAALSGESILLLGPPGIAKSMIARRLKTAFAHARSFEYLMSRFSTPDEIFGPISIAKLKKSDKYERAIDGYLPTADVVFLDEIWKAGPAIQNTLLTVMNEKLFRNGEEEIRLPLKLLVAASNELPAKGEGLEALWDRFLIRIVSHCIQDEEVFRKMLTQISDHDSGPGKEAEIDQRLTIQPKEYQQCQEASKKVILPLPVLEAITYIRQHLQQIELTTSELPRTIYVSDRRWKHIANLLRTAAYLQDRKEVGLSDLLLLYPCLWNEPEEIPAVRDITLHAVYEDVRLQLQKLSDQVKSDLEASQAQEALSRALRENDHRDEDLFIANRIYYQIENHGTGHTYIYITDFKRLPSRSLIDRHSQYLSGILYPDPKNAKRKIIRVVTAEQKKDFESKATEPVTLCRDDKHIFINGMAFNMRRNGTAILNPAAGKMGSLFDARTSTNANEENWGSGSLFAQHYEEDIERICDRLDQRKAELEGNLFVSREDRERAAAYAQLFNRRIALTRVDIRKLLYHEEE